MRDDITLLLSTTQIQVAEPGKEVEKAARLIETYKEKNDNKSKVIIMLDLKTEYLGYFLYESHHRRVCIYVNPVSCEMEQESGITGHPEDKGVCNTIMHEWGHFVDDKLNLAKEYKKKKWNIKNLYVTRYAKTSGELCEEIAELLALYFTNPYYLKLIDKERFDWFKSKFKSPAPCGKSTFMKYYNNWPKKIQNKTTKQWKEIKEVVNENS